MEKKQRIASCQIGDDH